MLRICVIIFYTLIFEYDAANILAVIPSASISHQAPFRPLTQELAKRGHQVTVITTNPAFPKGKAPKNLREIDVNAVAYEFWNKRLAELGTGRQEDNYVLINKGLDLFSYVFGVELAAPEVQELINNKNETFDLVFSELCVPPAIVFGHFYNAPVILLSSLGSMGGINELVGAPNHPLVYSFMISSNIQTELSMWKKINEIYDYYFYLDVIDEHEDVDNAIIRKYFGDSTPTLSEMSKNIHMVFLNVHPLWENNRPVPPNVVYMGGIHQTPEKELPKDLQSYLDSSKNGVIFFSLGSNVVPSLLPPKKIQVIINVFSKLPYDILWKYDKDELPNKPPNVRIEKWLPQSDLLKHPKIKLFITQGGLQSSDEAITAGVPLVGIPVMADQWLNVGRYVQHKIGVKVDFETITEDTFNNAIETVIRDESYRRNIEKLRDLMKDQPQSPLERAVWWTEHVLRHGGKHLRSPAAHMPWTQYYEIQLVSVLLASLLAALSLTVFVMYISWRYIRSFVISVKVKKS